jgi:8-oxo-dGTP diphosphatase
LRWSIGAAHTLVAMPETPAVDPDMALVRLSAAVYAQRDGKILILKRATGEVTGAWFLPSGGVDHGEPVGDAALRELFEESGLVPSGPLTLVGLARMHVYGVDSLQVAYACDCPEGAIKLSDEHSDARWIDPGEYRTRYFGDDLLAAIESRNSRIASIVRGVREHLDAYLRWRDHQFLDRQLRELRLTAEMFVVRDGKILLLKRKGGVGDGVWYLPGGVVEPGEDPADAAVRETAEECGLCIEHPQMVRVWGYPAQNGLDAFHATYLGESRTGDVVLSEEHSDFRWLDPLEYRERYCGPQAEALAPQWAGWFRQVRRNCELVSAWIKDTSGYASSSDQTPV